MNVELIGHTQFIMTLENHCTRTAQSSCGGCSRRVHKIMYLTVKRVIFCEFFPEKEDVRMICLCSVGSLTATYDFI